MSRTAVLKKYPGCFLFTGIILVLTIILWTPCRAAGTEPLIFRYRLPTDAPTLDPALSTDTTSGAVVLKIFDGLVQFDPDTLEVVPAVAESWDVSDDGLVFTFKLRKDVKFHNGRPVTARDVQYSFERTLDKKTKSGRVWVLRPIKGAEAFRENQTEHIAGLEIPDEYTVRITLEKPFAPFLAQLCMEAASIVPEEACELEVTGGFKSNPIGCGPFKFVSWQRDIAIILEANSDYYGGSPTIDEVHFKVINSDATAFEEYKAGGLDFLDTVPPGQIQMVRKKFPEDLKEWPYLSIYYIGFNHSKPPFKGNRYLRQAINYAVDKEKICLAIKEGTGYPVAGALPPGIPGYDPDLKGYPYNPEKARELMVKAGYPNGEGLSEITLWHNRDPRHRLIGECIQYYLSEIGISLRLKNVEWAAYMEACDEGEPLMYRMGWVADYPDADNFLYILLHSSQAGSPGNYARYNNPEFDRLVEEARLSPDPDRRLELYRQAEKVIIEDAAWLFIYYDQELAMIKPRWTNLHLSPQGDFTLPLSLFRLRENVN